VLINHGADDGCAISQVVSLRFLTLEAQESIPGFFFFLLQHSALSERVVIKLSF
jgi:hypothetical protein